MLIGAQEKKQEQEQGHTSFRKPCSSLGITDALSFGPQGRVPSDPCDEKQEGEKNVTEKAKKKANENDDIREIIIRNDCVKK
jgi:hypothetical protein